MYSTAVTNVLKSIIILSTMQIPFCPFTVLDQKHEEKVDHSPSVSCQPPEIRINSLRAKNVCTIGHSHLSDRY